ncbi:MAG: tyrosine-protein phosphatase [Synergistaceae bacterium]|nr:tyrosine-protein phosphatase [Synergistaceae bacterium]
MRRLKIFHAVALIIAVVLVSSSAQADDYGKTLYRSLSKRLGRNREDYPALSDLEFANFREVHTTGIAKGRLFRSSSPVSTWGNRNKIADNAARLAGVKTFINLADSNQSVKEHKGYSGSYYSTQKMAGLNLNMKYSSTKFTKSLAYGIHFMAVNEPPYLIHCSLSKDRAGYVCALIECLAGAGLDEIERDYMTSFRNYFGIVEGTKEYDFIVRHEILKFLAQAFGVKNILAVNLSEAAEKYFISIGVSPDDIKTLREKLRD